VRDRRATTTWETTDEYSFADDDDYVERRKSMHSSHLGSTPGRHVVKVIRPTPKSSSPTKGVTSGGVPPAGAGMTPPSGGGTKRKPAPSLATLRTTQFSVSREMRQSLNEVAFRHVVKYLQESITAECVDGWLRDGGAAGSTGDIVQAQFSSYLQELTYETVSEWIKKKEAREKAIMEEQLQREAKEKEDRDTRERMEAQKRDLTLSGDGPMSSIEYLRKESRARARAEDQVPSTQEVHDMVRGGNALQLNRVLKNVSIETLMNQCVDPQTGHNPLHLACLLGQQQLVHLFLKKKADPTVLARSENAYALHLFLRYGLQTSLAAQKLVSKAQEAQDEEDEPKHSFVMPIVQRLLAGIPIESRMQTGANLLHCACYCAPPDVVQLLVVRNANACELDGAGKLPLDILIEGGHPQAAAIAPILYERTDLELLRTRVRPYMLRAVELKSKELYNIVSVWEYEYVDRVFFDKRFFDFPSELAFCHFQADHVEVLKAATPEKLTELVVLSEYDHEESVELAHAYRLVMGKFVTPLDLFNQIWSQYDPLQVRGAASLRQFLRLWAGDVHSTLFGSKAMNSLVTTFIADVMSDSGKLGADERALHDALTARRSVTETVAMQDEIRETWTCGEDAHVHSEFEGLGANAVAKQLSIWNMTLHRLISPTDLLLYAENQGKCMKDEDNVNGGSGNLRKAQALGRVQDAIKYFNSVSFWAATMILIARDVEHRRSTVEFLVKVMDLCMVCKNFNTAYAILLGLRLRAISRLSVTLAMVSDECQCRITKMCDLFSHQGSHKNYRDAILSYTAPAIPYLGLLLRDITYANDGSPDFLGSEEQLVNFTKYRRIHRLIDTYHTKPLSKTYDFRIVKAAAECVATIGFCGSLVNEETLLELSRHTETGSGKGEKTKSRMPKQDAEQLRSTLESIFLPPPATPEGVPALPATVARTRRSMILNKAKSGGAFGFLSDQFTASTDTLPTASSTTEAKTQDGLERSEPGGTAADQVLATQGSSFEQDDGEALFKISVMTGDGFHLGFLEYTDNEKSPLSLSVKATQSSCFFQVHRRVDGYPEKTVAVQSVKSRRFLGHRPRDTSMSPMPWNCLDISNSKWRVFQDEAYSTVGYFVLNSKLDVVEMCPKRDQALMFTLQRTGSAINNLFHEKLDVLLLPPAQPPPQRFRRRPWRGGNT